MTTVRELLISFSAVLDPQTLQKADQQTKKAASQMAMVLDKGAVIKPTLDPSAILASRTKAKKAAASVSKWTEIKPTLDLSAVESQSKKSAARVGKRLGDAASVKPKVDPKASKKAESDSKKTAKKVSKTLGKAGLIKPSLDAAGIARVKAQVGDLGAFLVQTLGGTLFFAGLGRAVSGVVQLASNAEEQLNIINQAFGDNADEVRAWANTFADEAGRNRYEMEQTAGLFGSVLNPLMKGNTEEAAAMSKGLSQLTVDLGSFYNVADSQVLTALRSGISGESEPMKRFGVILTEATMEAFALENGINKSIRSMSIAEKTALRYQFILDQTSIAQGDAARTAESWANAKKAAISKLKELATGVGMKLLPVMSKLAILARTVVTGFLNFVEGTRLLEASLVVLGAVAAKVAIGMLIAFAPVLIPLLKLAAVMGLVALAVDDFLVFLEGGDSVLGRFIDALFGPGSATAAAEGLKQAWEDLKVFWLESVVPALNKLKQEIGKFAKEAAPYISELISLLGDGIKIAFDAWFLVFGFLTDVVIPSLIEAVVGIATVFTETIDTVVGFFDFLSDETANRITEIVDLWYGFSALLRDLWESLKFFIFEVILGIDGKNSESEKSFRKTWTSFFEFLFSMWDSVYTYVAGVIKDIKKLFRPLLVLIDKVTGTDPPEGRGTPKDGGGGNPGGDGGRLRSRRVASDARDTLQNAGKLLGINTSRATSKSSAPNEEAPRFGGPMLPVPAFAGGGVTLNQTNNSNVTVQGSASAQTAERIGRVADNSGSKAAKRTIAALKQRAR